MGRRLTAALAIVFATFITVAAPGALATNVGVYDLHTTDTDFNNAQELNNVSVTGSGQSARVVFANDIVDDYEDNDLSEYGGNTADASVQSTLVYNGTSALNVTGGSGDPVVSTSGLDHYPTQGEPFSAFVRFDQSDDGDHGLLFFAQSTSNNDGYEVELRPGNDRFELSLNGSNTLDTDSTDPGTYADEWLNVTVYPHQNGDINVTIKQVSTGNTIATLDANDGTYSSGGFGASSRQTGSGGAPTFTVDWVQNRDGNVGTYISANYTAENVVDGWANLSIDNATATVTWQGLSGGSWTDVASSTYTTTGNRTISLSGSYTKWRVNVTFNKSSGYTKGRIYDEGLRITNYAPTVDNSSASPNGTIATADPVTLSIDVNDSDFSRAHGDSVDVEFFHKGPSESSFDPAGTDTLTSNGTATLDIPAEDGGEHEWYVWANDSYGGTQQSATANFTRPDSIGIRNETNASQFIKSPITVHATIFSSDRITVVEKEVTDGNVSLSGVPVTKPVVIRFEADGWYTRSFYVEDLFEQDDAYLLNSTAYPNAKTVEFQLDDRTGDFEEKDNTTIRVQRAVDKNNNDTLSWETVSGDYFDAAGGFFFTGQTDARYRIIVENNVGNRRNLGPYVVVESRVETLVIGEVQWPAENGSATYYLANISYEPDGTASPPVIAVKYFDPGQNTTDLNITIYEQGNQSNQIYSDTPTGTYGEYVAEVNITDEQANNVTWVVEARYDYNGEAQTQKRLVGSKKLDLPIDPNWLGGAVLVFVPMLISLYGPRTWQYGLGLTLAVVGIAMLFQWITIPIAGYAVAILIALAGVFRTELTVS